MQIGKGREDMESEHRRAIGAESKVMERTCRARNEKDGDGKEEI